MQGQGRNQPRLITITLHVLTNELPEASNISEQKQNGMNRFLYLLLLQKTLESATLGNTSQLRFISENVVDTPVVNYHTQTYEFEVLVDDMWDDEAESEWGQFEELNIYGSLR